MNVYIVVLLATVGLVWAPWVLVRLSWTDTFPITSWRDFIPMHTPERFKK